MPRILEEYDRVVGDALAHASSIDPIATGLTASLDHIYAIGQTRLDTLARASTRERGAGELASTILDRVRAGRGGELVVLRDGGADWMVEVLGQPDRAQIGGNAAQASWSLAMVGAPTILSLLDRSSAQLAALHPRILLAGPDGTTPAGQARAQGRPLKQPHAILEFAAGTLVDGAQLPRSTRVMLRFSHEPLETDAFFLDHCRTGRVSAALLSGLATQPDLRTADVRWAIAVAEVLTQRNVFVHHELSEFANPVDLRESIGILPVTSVGMSLSELMMAASDHGDPAMLATAFAEAAGVGQVVVHADEWALLVTTDPSPARRDTLILANALASARARLGRPSGEPHPNPDARFTDDLPPGGRVRDGWHALVVPAPYESQPRATVGLGDTFVAGLLLGQATSPSASTSTRKANL